MSCIAALSCLSLLLAVADGSRRHVYWNRQLRRLCQEDTRQELGGRGR